MRNVLFLVLLLTGFSNFVFSQTTEIESERIEISVCQPLWTEAGRQSSFHFNFVYLVIADKNGLVKKVKEVSDNKNFRYLTDDKDIVPCIEKWKLKPSKTYIITISVGTTGDQYLLISDKEDKIKINL